MACTISHTFIERGKCKGEQQGGEEKKRKRGQFRYIERERETEAKTRERENQMHGCDKGYVH